MSWGDGLFKWLIPPTYRPDPSTQIDEVLEAQGKFLEAATATSEAADKSLAGIEASTEQTKKRVACRRTTDPAIKAARDALKVLERRQ